MIAGRLRECLKILRWEADDLAAELGRPRGEIAAWLDGRSPAPLAVAAWLEALGKAHRALPAPGRIPALQPARLEPDTIGITYPAAQFSVQRIHSHSPYPRRPRSRMRDPLQVLHNREEARAMNHRQFEEPVTLLVGMGFPARIESVVEAYALLQDWPACSRNGAHAVALNACKAGIAGEIDPETVRATLVAFARRQDILVPDLVSLAPAALAGGASSTHNTV